MKKKKKKSTKFRRIRRVFIRTREVGRNRCVSRSDRPRLLHTTYVPTRRGHAIFQMFCVRVNILRDRDRAEPARLRPVGARLLKRVAFFNRPCAHATFRSTPKRQHIVAQQILFRNFIVLSRTIARSPRLPLIIIRKIRP